MTVLTGGTRRSVEHQSQHIRCDECGTAEIPWHPVQTRILVILNIFLGMWNNAMPISEAHMVNGLLPMQEALHSCRVSSAVSQSPQTAFF